MPFDLIAATARLSRHHAEGLEFRRTLLDIAFTAACPLREEAVSLEHGDALMLHLQSPSAGALSTARSFAVVDLEPPGHRAAWPETLDSLGGPLLAQTWAVALHALLASGGDLPWRLLYVRGPALGTADYLRERLGDGGAAIQLAPCPTVARAPAALDGVAPAALDGVALAALDGVALTLRRAENVWRLPACDWTAQLTVQQPQPLALLRSWLAALRDPWTLHELQQPSATQLTAILRAARPLVLPAGVSAHAARALPRLSFPVNDALLAWPEIWLPQPLAVTTQPDGLWLAGLRPALPAGEVLPESLAGLSAEWQVTAVARRAAAESLLAVTAAEAQGPVAAGLDGPLWRLPGAGEVALAVRGLTARLGNG